LRWCDADLDRLEIDPSILGTLFERGLDPGTPNSRRTTRTGDKIMLLLEPVVVRPLLIDWEAEKTSIAAELERAEVARSRAAWTKRSAISGALTSLAHIDYPPTLAWRSSPTERAVPLMFRATRRVCGSSYPRIPTATATRTY